MVPLDGSEHSLRALTIATEIAKKFSGKISLIHVYSVSVSPVMVPEPTTLTPPITPILTPTEVSKTVETIRKASMRILEEGEQKVKAEGVEVETILKEGHVVQEIIKTAEEGNFDLVVIGARGISKIRELLLGSVTDGVIHHASCPVLVTRVPKK